MLAISTVALLGAPASAAVPTANSKFCTAASQIGKNAGPTSSKSSPASLKALAKAIDGAAASAPAKVKSAMHAMSSYVRTEAAGKQPTNVQQYAKAAITFTTYLGKNCRGVTP
jgi:hypothetical protein